MDDEISDVGVTDLEPAADPASTDVAATSSAEVEVAEDQTEVQDGAPRTRRRLDIGLLLASLVIAGGLVLIIVGFLTARTGDDGIDRPDAIESLTPVENAIQVLQQESIVVDLQFGYEARLVVDGIELPTTRLGQIEAEPGEQISLPPTAIFDAGNSIISYKPIDGAPIEEFTEGLHTVRVIYWRIDEGPDQALSYTWTFNVV